MFVDCCSLLISYYGSFNNKDFSFLVHFYDPVVELLKNRIKLSKRVDYGPCQPVLSFPRTNIGGKNRSFRENYYTQFKWIEYSPSKDAAFCFPCRLFKGNSINGGQIDLAFTSKGFKN